MKKRLTGKKTYPSGLVVDFDKIKYNPELDKYDDVVLFPKKVAKMEEAIKHPSFQKLMDEIKKKESQ